MHGALLDAEILAYVYLAMTGGQKSLFDDADTVAKDASEKRLISQPVLQSCSPLLNANPDELSEHHLIVQFIIKQSGVDHFS